MAVSAITDPAAEAYEALAPFYDAYTAGYDYERWLGNLEPTARELGLEGHRLLDVACGTGKSFVPMLARGYEVTACDISPAMVECAREHAGDRPVDLHVADMRELPLLGTFDVATCLDDALNYLLTDAELEGALAGIARNLRPGGILVFDVNTLSTYRDVFASDSEMECGDALFSWRGTGDRAAPPGALSAAGGEVCSLCGGQRGV